MKRKIGSQILASILVNSVYAMINYPVVLINTLLAPLAILAVVTFASKGALLQSSCRCRRLRNIPTVWAQERW